MIGMPKTPNGRMLEYRPVKKLFRVTSSGKETLIVDKKSEKKSKATG